MGILRLVARIMGRISTFRSYQLVLLLAAALAVVAFYYFASERQNFSSTTKRIKQTQASHNANRNSADLTVDTGLSHPPGFEEQEGEARHAVGESEGPLVSKKVGGDAGDRHYHALMMFTKVDKSRSLQDKFRVAMLSMVKHGRFLEGEVLVLHFVSDQASKELGEKMLQEFLQDATFKYEVGHLIMCAHCTITVSSWFPTHKSSQVLTIDVFSIKPLLGSNKVQAVYCWYMHYSTLLSEGVEGNLSRIRWLEHPEHESCASL